VQARLQWNCGGSASSVAIRQPPAYLRGGPGSAGRLVPKDEIIRAAWPNVVVSDESVARCVSDVRFALGDRGQRIIKTVPRGGYLFAAEVNGVSPAAAEAEILAAVLPASEPSMPALVEVAPTYDPRGQSRSAVI
jgi:DNA-binding winged helix-turn-helix (wHTH) protein